MCYWNGLLGSVLSISTTIRLHTSSINISSAPFLFQDRSSLHTEVFSFRCLVALLLTQTIAFAAFLRQRWLLFQSTLLIGPLQFGRRTRLWRRMSTERPWPSRRIISLRLCQGIWCARYSRVLGVFWFGRWAGFFGRKIWTTGSRTSIICISCLQTLFVCRIEERILITGGRARRMDSLGFRTSEVRSWIYGRLSNCRHVKIIRYLPRPIQIVSYGQSKIEILRLILLIFLSLHRFTALLHIWSTSWIQWNIQCLLQKLFHAFLMPVALACIAESCLSNFLLFLSFGYCTSCALPSTICRHGRYLLQLLVAGCWLS